MDNTYCLYEYIFSTKKFASRCRADLSARYELLKWL